MIKFLHAADLHLDSPFSGLSPELAAQRRIEQRAMVMELTELCNQEQCDLMLLAGDLFDSDNTWPETIEALQRAFSACHAKVFISPGNHDYYTPGCAYAVTQWPDNVHIFSSQTPTAVELPELGCVIWGAAFTQATSPSLLEQFQIQDRGLANLMVLHGDALFPSSPYNPISTEQIAASGLTYLALGHIHQCAMLQPAGSTVYAWPGCPMGRGFDETGPKGVLLGTIRGEQCQVPFHPLPGRRYEVLQIEAGADPLASILSALPPDTQSDCYRILLTGESAELRTTELYQQLAPRFFSLQLRDQTVAPLDLWEKAGENSLEGLFVQMLRAQYDATQDAAQRCRIERAVKIGLSVMAGREVTLL